MNANRTGNCLPIHGTLAVVLAFVVFGCRGIKGDEQHYFDEMACQYEPWDWYIDDPVGMVMQANENGLFDFDPDDFPRTNIDGKYDFESGDLNWETMYRGDHYMTDRTGEGYGTIYDNGNLDLLYAVQAQDELGDTWATRVRQVRTKCSETRSVWSLGADDDYTDTPDDDPTEYDIEIVSNNQVQADTVLENTSYGDVFYTMLSQADLTDTTTFEAEDGSLYGQSTYSGDGSGVGVQETHDGDYDYYYDFIYNYDGSTDISFEGFEEGSGSMVAQCTYTETYAGEGSGTCWYEGDLNCDLTYDADSCELDCGSDGTFDC